MLRLLFNDDNYNRLLLGLVMLFIEGTDTIATKVYLTILLVNDLLSRKERVRVVGVPDVNNSTDVAFVRVLFILLPVFIDTVHLG